MNSLKTVFISWAPYCSRSDNIAREFAGKSYKVYYEFFGSNFYTILFKYFFQSIKTMKILLTERPNVIFVMSPPIITCVPVYIYCKFFKAIYIIDSHTASFSDHRWKHFLFIHKFFSTKAFLTIVTNDYLKSIVDSWKASASIISDVPIVFKDFEFLELRKGFNLMFINTFAKDEPIENVLEAAKSLPEINFYITGNLTDAKKKNINIQSKPNNVEFVGFVPDNQYNGLLKTVDAVMVLTTRDHTMQRGGYEAVYMRKPIITSHWDILKKNFNKGAVFVDNSVKGITAGINEMKCNLKKYEKDTLELRKDKLIQWEQKKKNILLLIDEKISKY